MLPLVTQFSLSTIYKGLPFIMGFLGGSLGEGNRTHSNTPAWRVLWTEEPGRLQSMGSQRVGHNWATFTSLLHWQVDSLPLSHQGSPRKLLLLQDERVWEPLLSNSICRRKSLFTYWGIRSSLKFFILKLFSWNYSVLHPKLFKYGCFKLRHMHSKLWLSWGVKLGFIHVKALLPTGALCLARRTAEYCVC